MCGLDAARRVAIHNIRSIQSDIDEGVIDLRGKIEIASERGEVLMVVRFAEAVDLQLGNVR